MYAVIYRRGGEREGLKKQIKMKRIKEKEIERLTCLDDLGHRAEGVFLACYWSVLPRWSPRGGRVGAGSG